MKIDLKNITCISCNKNLEYKRVYLLNSRNDFYDSCNCGSIKISYYNNLLNINFTNFELSLHYGYYCVYRIDCNVNSDLFKEILYSDKPNLSEVYLEIIKIYNNLIFQ